MHEWLGLHGPAPRAASPRSRVIVLTVYEDDDKILRAARGGAAGSLLKSSSLEEVLDGLRRTVSGEAALDGMVARRLLELVADPPAAASLTAREQAILAALCRGESMKEIAATVGVSPHTVDFHLRHIHSKLGVHNRTGAVSAALRRGLPWQPVEIRESRRKIDSPYRPRIYQAIKCVPYHASRRSSEKKRLALSASKARR